MPPAFPSELRYAAYYAYTPGASDPDAQRGLRVRDRIKGARDLEGLIQPVGEAFQADWFEDFFGSGITIVPVPRSHPLTEGALWPAQEIADRLVALELAGETIPLLERVEPVAKSSFQSGSDRPRVHDHVTSMQVAQELAAPTQILLVDDVVTIGRTFWACAGLLRERFEEAEIRAFALLRTQGIGPVVTDPVAPVEGKIWRPADRPPGWLERDP